ncbi:AAA family ATPase [Halobacteriovorax sp. YZS-1-1]|uniref:AAA family ATPase n=1 Tax=unclassified Halobacteriovorax TaxID=2639665 RepID=UPI00399A006E
MIEGIDKALSEFNEYESNISDFLKSDMTETDTRSKVIDHMFKNVLGWEEVDILREESVESGFYDYKFSTSDFSFIVEAKKNAVDFILPEKQRYVTLGTLAKGNKSVIEQIRRYIFDKGLAFGIITNGHQYIVSQFINTSGEDWRKNKAIVFRDLDDISENFILFYNCISKAAVQYNKMLKLNLPSRKPNLLVDVLKGADRALVRNDLSAQLAKVIIQAFGELANQSKDTESELLKSCYVKNEDIKKYNSELGIALEDNAPDISENISKAKNTNNINRQLKDNILNGKKIPQNPPLMIIIGGKGVGKTTFIKNFFEIEMSKKSKLTRPSVYIDFRDYTEQGVSDSKTIFQKIITQLKREYPELRLGQLGVLKQIYFDEIKENKSSIWQHLENNTEKLNEKIANFLERSIENPTTHLEKISHYLRNHCNKNLCVVFDNADQLSDEAQKEAFLLANSIHNKLYSITIISLREGYYNRWKRKPPFDAFQSLVFHISAPPYREVIRKRIEYVEKNIAFDPIESTFNGRKLTITEDGFKKLFANLYYTLFDVQNNELIKFLEETSFPNIRLGIEKINKFLVSGHTNISSYMLGDNYRIPIWEFVKSIALDSSKYYHSDQSIVLNLFKPVVGNNNHFTKIRILKFLELESEGIVDENRFFPVKGILDVFRLAGYTDEIILGELTELLNSILIDNQIISSDIDSDGMISELSQVRITYSGMYYLNNMICQFHYLSLVLQDTPIFDEAFFEKIKYTFPEVNQYGKSELSKRMESVKYFTDYLKEEENFDHERTLVESFHPCLKINVMDSLVCNSTYNDRIRLIEGKLAEKNIL